MNTPELAVLIPNFKTPELIRIALRLLKLHTADLSRIEILVVDNDSQDESAEYLRTIPWIRLFERPAIPGEPGYVQHARSLDMLLEHVTAPYVMVMHTDTFLIADDWLDYLLSFFKDQPKLAGVGSWKLEKEPFLKSIGQELETAVRRLFGHKIRSKERYLRSHCAVYRTGLLRHYTGGFYDGESAGVAAHRKLLKAGFEMKFIPAKELIPHVVHLNHATVILHPESGGKRTSKPQAAHKLQKEMAPYLAMLERTDLDGITR